MTPAPATLGDDELLIAREFDAPVELVFRMWESADHLIRWWGPEIFTTTHVDWEATPGRPWRITMASKKYRVSSMGGVIREVEKNIRLVFTFAWDEDSGRDMDTLITVTFADRNGKTLQTFHQTPFSTVTLRDSHIGGWNSLFNRQQAFVENVAFAETKGVRI
jgi:uncharacterized protein YndB with AHSA1/START domain